MTFCILDILPHSQTTGVSLPNQLDPLVKMIPSYPSDLGPLNGRLGTLISRCSTSLSHFNRVPHPATSGLGPKPLTLDLMSTNPQRRSGIGRSINLSTDQKRTPFNTFPFGTRGPSGLQCYVASVGSAPCPDAHCLGRSFHRPSNCQNAFSFHLKHFDSSSPPALVRLRMSGTNLRPIRFDRRLHATAAPNGNSQLSLSIR